MIILTFQFILSDPQTRQIHRGNRRRFAAHLTKTTLKHTYMATSLTIATLNPEPKKLFPENIELNVGGRFYSTTVLTLTKIKDSLLGKVFSGKEKAFEKDSTGKHFIDRDGLLFRYILDFLRTRKIHLPDDFDELERLKDEADYYELEEMRRQLELFRESLSPKFDENCGHISLHVRRTFAFGRSGQADIKFRKMRRILICGRVSLCKEVFGASLNETRDPNPHRLRYTNRFFLKFNQIEKAFTLLGNAGFEMVSSDGGKVAVAESSRTEEEKWENFVSYYFLREKPPIRR